jgi:hypothetical protein
MEKQEQQSNKITKKSILLVEGEDEKNFFDKLLKSKSLEINDVQCISAGGEKSFKARFGNLSREEAFRYVNKIAFIRDAEKNEAYSALDSIKSAVKSAKTNTGFDIECISSLTDNVKDIVKDKMRCGVYIMPDNKNSGALENLCIKYMKTEPIHNCVEGYIRCAQSNGAILKNKSKAKIFAYLSTKIADAPSIGVAAKQGVFDFDNTCFDGIKDFLKRVFSA